MAKTRGVEVKLDRLRALRREPPAPAHLAELRQALADNSNLVAAEAAEIVGERVLPDFETDLVAAFDRFMIDAEETDKLCRAKINIIEALNKLEYYQDEIFLRGIRHVQMEPRWGGSEDSAGPLRGVCAYGLLRLNHRDLLPLLADLLADVDKVARQAAARALGESRLPGAAALLRFKARLGDAEPEVLGECVSGLLLAAFKESQPVVAELLASADEAKQEAAALALGESRRPEALDLLLKHWPRARGGDVQDVFLFAIATTRLPAAIDFLLEILAGDDAGALLGALNALAIHRHNDVLRQRVAATVAASGHAGLVECFRKKFEKVQ